MAVAEFSIIRAPASVIISRHRR